MIVGFMCGGFFGMVVVWFGFILFFVILMIVVVIGLIYVDIFI